MYFFKGESVPSLYTKILDTVSNEGRIISPLNQNLHLSIYTFIVWWKEVK